MLSTLTLLVVFLLVFFGHPVIRAVIDARAYGYLNNFRIKIRRATYNDVHTYVTRKRRSNW